MTTQVFRLNQCIGLYCMINYLSDYVLKIAYTRLIEEYNINRQLISKMYILKNWYYLYLDNLFLPHINYMSNILEIRQIAV